MTEPIAKTAAVQTQVLALELGLTESAQKEIIQKHLVAMLAMERERCAQIIEARLPLYTELGHRNALKECISSIRSAGE